MENIMAIFNEIIAWVKQIIDTVKTFIAGWEKSWAFEDETGFPG